MKTLNLDMPDDNCYIFSESTGLVEHCLDLGDEVKSGQLIAKVHNIERTGSLQMNIMQRLMGYLQVNTSQALLLMVIFLASLQFQSKLRRFNESIICIR